MQLNSLRFSALEQRMIEFRLGIVHLPSFSRGGPHEYDAMVADTTHLRIVAVDEDIHFLRLA